MSAGVVGCAAVGLRAYSAGASRTHFAVLHEVAKVFFIWFMWRIYDVLRERSYFTPHFLKLCVLLVICRIFHFSEYFYTNKEFSVIFFSVVIPSHRRNERWKLVVAFPPVIEYVQSTHFVEPFRRWLRSQANRGVSGVA